MTLLEKLKGESWVLAVIREYSAQTQEEIDVLNDCIRLIHSFEGCGRLIDADKLKECFAEDTFKNRMVKVIIDRQPTVEVEKEDETLRRHNED